MLSAYIATFTAFAVTNVNLPEVLVWIVPTVVGSTGISLTITHYKRLFRARQERWRRGERPYWESVRNE